jgi:uncharacterized protein
MFLIDGYNLMHAAGLMKSRFGPGGLEKARRALVGVLAGSLGDKASRATIVFDAPPGDAEGQGRVDPLSAHGIHVEFAAKAGGADARIEQLIGLESAPKQLTVVSSDSRLQSAARRRGAHALSSDKFWHDLVERRVPRGRRTPPTEKQMSRTRRDSDEWIREFEGLISDDDLRELAGPFGNETQS